MTSFYLVTKIKSVLQNCEFNMTLEESIHTSTNNSDALKLMISVMFSISMHSSNNGLFSGMDGIQFSLAWYTMSTILF